jgi:hypothetical protein
MLSERNFSLHTTKADPNLGNLGLLTRPRSAIRLWHALALLALTSRTFGIAPNPKSGAK